MPPPTAGFPRPAPGMYPQPAPQSYMYPAVPQSSAPAAYPGGPPPRAACGPSPAGPVAGAVGATYNGGPASGGVAGAASGASGAAPSVGGAVPSGRGSPPMSAGAVVKDLHAAFPEVEEGIITDMMEYFGEWRLGDRCRHVGPWGTCVSTCGRSGCLALRVCVRRWKSA